MKIYLDIDKTILWSDYYNSYPAKHLKEFLTAALDKHDIYWLTTHCDGDANTAVAYLSRYFDEELIALIRQIKPTSWKNRKIEAIDLSEDFLWFYDMLLDSEERDLIKHGKLDSYVYVYLAEDQDIFQRYMKII